MNDYVRITEEVDSRKVNAANRECLDAFERNRLAPKEAAAVVALLMLAVEETGLDPNWWPMLRKQVKAQSRKNHQTVDQEGNEQ